MRKLVALGAAVASATLAATFLQFFAKGAHGAQTGFGPGEITVFTAAVGVGVFMVINRKKKADKEASPTGKTPAILIEKLIFNNRSQKLYLNIALSATYALASIALFAFIQFFAIIAPGWTTVAVGRYYVRNLGKMPTPTPGWPAGTSDAVHHDWSWHMFFIIVIVAGAFMTVLITISSIKALVNIGLGRHIPGHAVKELGSEVESKIDALVSAVSRSTRVNNFRCIYITKDSTMATLYTIGGRYLILGILGLRYLTSQEIRAIVAHECGHHHDGAMLLQRIHYRTSRLFSGLLTVFRETYGGAERIMKDKYWFVQGNPGAPMAMFRNYLGTMAGAMIFPLFAGMFVYRQFLAAMDFLMRDSRYEYYCDAISIKIVGGTIFSSALQKSADLNLAEKVIEGIEKGEDGESDSYLDRLDREYNRLRMQNPQIRRQMVVAETGTHPPLYLRLARARSAPRLPDSSMPILTDTEFNFCWDLLSKLSR